MAASSILTANPPSYSRNLLKNLPPHSPLFDTLRKYVHTDAPIFTKETSREGSWTESRNKFSPQLDLQRKGKEGAAFNYAQTSSLQKGSVRNYVCSSCMCERDFTQASTAEHAQPAPGTALGQQNPLGKAMRIFPHEHS